MFGDIHCLNIKGKLCPSGYCSLQRQHLCANELWKQQKIIKELKSATGHRFTHSQPVTNFPPPIIKSLCLLFVIKPTEPHYPLDQTLFKTSSELEICWHRIVEEQEVHAIEVVQPLLVKRADIVEELSRHVSCSPGAFGRGGEADLVLHPSHLQHVAGVLLQRLVFPYHVVVDEAGVAQRVHALPVFVKGLFSLSGWVHQVIHKLLKGDVVSLLQSFWLRGHPVPPHYLGAVALVESGVVAARELVAVRGHQPLERLTHKDELQIRAQALVDLGSGKLGKHAKVSWDVGFVGGDGKRVSLGPRGASQNHEDPLPVGTGHFGHVAVQQAMLVVHDDVFEVFGDEDSPFARVGAARFLQQFPTTLMDSLHCRLNLQETEKAKSFYYDKPPSPKG